MKRFENMTIANFKLQVNLEYTAYKPVEETATLDIAFKDLSDPIAPIYDSIIELEINIAKTILNDDDIINMGLAMYLKNLKNEKTSFECIFTNNAILIITANDVLEIIKVCEEDDEEEYE